MNLKSILSIGALTALSLFMTSCLKTPTPSVKNLEKSKLMDSSVKIGDSLTASRYADLYFSGQPSLKDFKKLKEQGFASIINLQPKSEFDEGPQVKLIKSLGLNYKNVPFKSGADLTTELMNKITKTVVSLRPQGKVLIHCRSGNRVGIWLAGHFYKDHKYSKEKALATAKNLGLTSPGSIKKAQSYLEKN